MKRVKFAWFAYFAVFFTQRTFSAANFLGKAKFAWFAWFACLKSSPANLKRGKAKVRWSSL